MRRSLTILAEVIVLVGLYLAVGAAMTWPMAADPAREVVGGGEFGGWLWRIWWHFQ